MGSDKLRWGIIGAGAIADAFVRGVQSGGTGEVVAVGSRSSDKAAAFAEKFSVARPHGSYEGLLDDDSVDAVYIATPHPMHARWAILAAEAGKHALVEKPFALNEAQAGAMFQAAAEHDVFMMEAFMYRCSPQTAKLVELLRDGAVGEVRGIRASFAFNAGFNPDSRLFSNGLAGGGIMDVGCYAVSMSRLVAGAAAGKAFANPTDVVALGKLTETGVDGYTAAVLRFDQDIIAQVATGVQLQMDNQAVIFGTEGRIVLPNPWMASRVEPQPGLIELHREGEVDRIEVPADRTSFSYEADAVAEAIARGDRQPASPAMTWDDTLGNLAALDRWRRAVGVVYEAETPQGQGRHTAAGRPLKTKPRTHMRYGSVEGVSKRISRFVLGCDNQVTFPQAAVVCDDWFERGGNAFDTAYGYGDGLQEKLLGQWIRARGVRDDVVVIVKGAHTPNCNPDALSQQLATSLERLQTDHADLYIMHRDNPDIPAGEFVDVLNEHLDAGRFQAFGGSNWTLGRIAEANAYAAEHGKRGFGVVSNNLSLARMVKPVWDGCVHVSDPASRQWLAEHGLPNFAWSSQARGYFLPEDQRMKLGEDNFACWDAPDNRARRERAEQLAQQKGVSPINIAAAWVLCQPFATFGLIGPRRISETAACMPALDVELTQQEIDWLWGPDA